jgi:hypothetical protein
MEKLTPSMLRDVARKSNEDKGRIFWEEFQPSLFKRLKFHAESGDYQCKIEKSDKTLNPYGWLSCPHLYEKVVKELEHLDFSVSHNDDRDGTYIIIKW